MAARDYVTLVCHVVCQFERTLRRPPWLCSGSLREKKCRLRSGRLWVLVVPKRRVGATRSWRAYDPGCQMCGHRIWLAQSRFGIKRASCSCPCLCFVPILRPNKRVRQAGRCRASFLVWLLALVAFSGSVKLSTDDGLACLRNGKVAKLRTSILTEFGRSDLVLACKHGNHENTYTQRLLMAETTSL